MHLDTLLPGGRSIASGGTVVGQVGVVEQIHVGVVGLVGYAVVVAVKYHNCFQKSCILFSWSENFTYMWYA